MTEEDDLLEDYISAAREFLETQTKQVFCESSFEIFLNEWPLNGRVEFPISPIISIVSFEYIDANSAYVAIDPTSYFEALYDAPPYLIYGSAGWPSVNCRPGAIRLEVRAGYASAGSPSDAIRVPHMAKQAIKMLVGHWYENRETVATTPGVIPASVPLGWDDLIYPLRRIY